MICKYLELSIFRAPLVTQFVFTCISGAGWAKNVIVHKVQAGAIPTDFDIPCKAPLLRVGNFTMIADNMSIGTRGQTLNHLGQSLG